METLITNVIIGLVAALSTVLVSKIAASGQKRAAEIETRGPDWDRFVERVERHNETTRKELHGRIDRLQNKVQRLEEKLDEKDQVILEKEQVILEKDEIIEINERKYRQSLSYALQWRRKHPKDSLVDALPADIREDLPEYWSRDGPGD